MWIVVLFWIVLVLWDCKYEKSGELQPFSKSNALVLKGICAIEIMLGHIGIATNSIFLYPNRKAGILFVGIFFALSGYGLMYSVNNKPDYLRGFLKKRLSKIILPAYIVYCISIVVSCVLQKEIYGLQKIVNLQNIFSGINWYIWELAALYVLFFIFIKMAGPQKCHWYILGASIFFIFIAYFLKIGAPWYGSTLCFWLGMVYYLKKNEFRSKIPNKKNTIIFVMSEVIVFFSIGMFFVLGEESFLGNVIGRNLASLFFVISIMILLQKVRIGNVVSRMLGKYSFEIYLIHFKVISICKPYIEQDFLFSICVIMITVILAILFQKSGDLLASGIKCVRENWLT